MECGHQRDGYALYSAESSDRSSWPCSDKRRKFLFSFLTSGKSSELLSKLFLAPEVQSLEIYHLFSRTLASTLYEKQSSEYDWHYPQKTKISTATLPHEIQLRVHLVQYMLPHTSMSNETLFFNSARRFLSVVITYLMFFNLKWTRYQSQHSSSNATKVIFYHWPNLMQ